MYVYLLDILRHLGMYIQMELNFVYKLELRYGVGGVRNVGTLNRYNWRRKASYNIYLSLLSLANLLIESYLISMFFIIHRKICSSSYVEKLLLLGSTLYYIII